MKIGVAKEIKPDEYRVALTPAGARELTVRGREAALFVDLARQVSPEPHPRELPGAGERGHHVAHQRPRLLERPRRPHAVSSEVDPRKAAIDGQDGAVHVVGGKSGGISVMTLAATHPELVKSAWDYFNNVQTKDVKYIPFISKDTPPATHLNTQTLAKYREQTATTITKGIEYLVHPGKTGPR